MDVTCTCGKTFEARSAKARYCSDRCRKRKGKADVLELSTQEADALGPVTLATIAELQDAGRFTTALGQTCLALANRLDHPGLDTGSAVAAVARQLEAALATATKGAGKKTAPQSLRDELAERRAAHGA